MTRVNKSKDGIIGPESKLIGDPIAPVGVVFEQIKSIKKMLKPELVELAISKNIDVEGKTKAQLIKALEK